MTEQARPARVRLPGISAEAFVSAADRVALRNLQGIPALPLLIRKFHEYTVDHLLYALNSAEAIRCGPRQCKTVFNLMREACAILDVPEPEIYLHYSPFANAYTAGMSKTFIVLHSGLVEQLTEEEILFVIGHEVGHIKCGHVLYQQLGYVLYPMLEELGRVTLGLGRLASLGLVTAYYEWFRQAEISGDRAGLLVCQQSQAAFGALMKMGGGSTRYNDEMSVDAFLEQARQHAEEGNAAAKVVLFILRNRWLTHPQVVHRAKALDEWIGTGAYEDLLAGNYPRDEAGTYQMGPQFLCAACGTRLSVTARVCPKCGMDYAPEPEEGIGEEPAAAGASTDETV
jgi:Zn-dependent protease with chaperone function